MTPRIRQWVRSATLIGLGIAALVGGDWLLGTESAADPVGVSADGGARAVRDLFEGRRSGEMVEVEGVVDRTLEDDDDGSRHQRFIVRLESGATVLVAHNIDLAARVPVRRGDRARVYGQYEWNEQGGLLHWTHRDPDGARPGGWIEVGGERYR